MSGDTYLQSVAGRLLAGVESELLIVCAEGTEAFAQRQGVDAEIAAKRLQGLTDMHGVLLRALATWVQGTEDQAPEPAEIEESQACVEMAETLVEPPLESEPDLDRQPEPLSRDFAA
jgi:hypothetical protein